MLYSALSRKTPTSKNWLVAIRWTCRTLQANPLVSIFLFGILVPRQVRRCIKLANCRNLKQLEVVWGDCFRQERVVHIFSHLNAFLSLLKASPVPFHRSMVLLSRVLFYLVCWHGHLKIKGRGTQYTLKRKNIAKIIGRDLGTRFTAWAGNTRYVLLVWSCILTQQW